MLEPIKPTSELPFEEAIQELTGFEVIGISKHYGVEFEKLGGLRSLMGTVWAFENRTAKTDWHKIEAMTLRELNGYFPEKDPDPDSDQGKGLSTPEESPSD